MKNREDYGISTDLWYSSLDKFLMPIALELRIIIENAVSEINESIKWGVPTFEKNGSVCALRAGKKYIALQFGAIGIELNDPDSLLEGTGKKMRHVKVWSKDDIKTQLFTTWIKSAAERS